MASSSDSFARLVGARKSVMHTTMQWIESQEGVKLESIEDVDSMKADNLSIIHDAEVQNEDESKADAVAPMKESVEISDSGSTGLIIEPLFSRQMKFLPIANTRILGQKFAVDLTKGDDGLGFSITARDNCAVGDSPIYIKTILPRGAAIKDGRLHPGDCILEVNGIDLRGKLQEEVTSILRCIETGSKVHLVIGRQSVDKSVSADECSRGKSSTGEMSYASNILVEETDESEIDVSAAEITNSEKTEQSVVVKESVSDTRDLSASCDENKSEENFERSQRQSDKKETILDRSKLQQVSIRLSKSDQSGLGLCIEERESEAVGDLGIFVRSFLPGGAASRNGKLQPGDRLVEVNGESLLLFSNVEARDILQHEIQNGDSSPVNLVVFRNNSSDKSTHQHIDGPASDPHSSVLPCTSNSPNLSNTISTPSKTGVKVQNLVEWKKPVQIESFVCLPSQMKTAKEPSCLRNVLESGSVCSESSVKTGCSSRSAKANDSLGLKGNSCLHLAHIKGSSSDLNKARCLSSSAKSEMSDNSVSDCDVEHDFGAFSRDGFGRQSVSEKHKACLDPHSFTVYQQIRAGRRDNNCNLLKRCSSIESVFCQKKNSHVANYNSVASIEQPRRSNSLESLPTTSPVHPTKLSSSQMSQSNWRLEQHPRHMVFHDSMKFFGASPIRPDNGSSLSEEKHDMSGSVMNSDNRKKKKMLRGLSSVFRKMKEKKPNNNNSNTWTKKNEPQKILLPSSCPREMLLQRAMSQQEQSNGHDLHPESSSWTRGKRFYTAEYRTHEEKRPEFIRWNRACAHETNVKHLACRCCSADLDMTYIVDEPIYSGRRELNQTQDSNQRKAYFNTSRTYQDPLLHSTYISADKLLHQDPQRSLSEKLGSSKNSNGLLDSGGRRFVCCNVFKEDEEEDEDCFSEGSYRKLELELNSNRSILGSANDEVFYGCKHNIRDVRRTNVNREAFGNWT